MTRTHEYNPYKIRNEDIYRFRGLGLSNLGAMLPQEFVGDLENVVSYYVGSHEARMGSQPIEALSNNGKVFGGHEDSLGFVCANGSVVSFERRAIPTVPNFSAITRVGITPVDVDWGSPDFWNLPKIEFDIDDSTSGPYGGEWNIPSATSPSVRERSNDFSLFEYSSPTYMVHRDAASWKFYCGKGFDDNDINITAIAVYSNESSMFAPAGILTAYAGGWGYTATKQAIYNIDSYSSVDGSFDSFTVSVTPEIPSLNVAGIQIWLLINGSVAYQSAWVPVPNNMMSKRALVDSSVSITVGTDYGLSGIQSNYEDLMDVFVDPSYGSHESELPQTLNEIGIGELYSSYASTVIESSKNTNTDSLNIFGYMQVLRNHATHSKKDGYKDDDVVYTEQSQLGFGLKLTESVTIETCIALSASTWGNISCQESGQVVVEGWIGQFYYPAGGGDYSCGDRSCRVERVNYTPPTTTIPHEADAYMKPVQIVPNPSYGMAWTFEDKGTGFVWNQYNSAIHWDKNTNAPSVNTRKTAFDGFMPDMSIGYASGWKANVNFVLFKWYFDEWSE